MSWNFDFETNKKHDDGGDSKGMSEIFVLSFVIIFDDDLNEN
jgi:hypothetical protein